MENVNVNFRSAQLEDLPILYAFEQGIITAERPYDPTLKPDPINYYDLKVLIEREDTEVVVALVGDEIVGSGYVKIKSANSFQVFEQYGYVGFMFVKPTFRRKGISQMIIQYLKSWTQSKGLTEMRLEVYEDNHKAVAAYEKIGLKKHLVEMRMSI